jgi:hypothetical protein
MIQRDRLKDLSLGPIRIDSVPRREREIAPRLNAAREGN